MIAVEDIIRIAFGAIVLVAIILLLRPGLGVLVMILVEKCVARFYALGTPAATQLTFGSATGAGASLVPTAVLRLVGTVALCPVAITAMRVCAENSSWFTRLE